MSMSGADQDRPAPRSSPAHLIERAAERLRLDGVSQGMIDSSAARMLHPDGYKAGLIAADLAPADGTLALEPPLLAAAPSPAAASGEAHPEIAGLDEGALSFASLNRRAGPRTDAEPPPPIELARMIAAGMIDWTHARSRLSEEFRIIQAQVLRQAFPADAGEPAVPWRNGADHGAPAAVRPAGNLVMITSARPREGKTFTSLNLAASIARQNDRDVLLIDIDSKRHSLTDQIGLRGRPGLMELAGDPKLDPQEVLTPTAMGRLSVLGFGMSPDGAELLASRQMARVLRNLGRRFAERLVILDAPPCLASSDASAVAPVVGQTIMVVEAEQTQRAEVEAALDLVQSCPSITLLLNKVQANSRHTFGGYYSYYAAS